MKLSVFERVILLNIIPQESDLTTLKIVRKMRDDLSFSEEEYKFLQFKTDENSMTTWEEGMEDIEVNIGEKATDIIVDAFKKLDSQKRLKLEHLPIYERFVEADENEGG